MKSSALALFALALAHRAHTLNYPGTETRPILSKTEADKYTLENYFNGWIPEDISLPCGADYLVEEGQSIQEVVNEAIRNGNIGNKSKRVYIKIKAGHYMETVYIKTDIPLTIVGGGIEIEDVHIMASLSAQTTVADYKKAVNPDGKRYKQGDPAWELYNQCASQNGTIGTACSAVFWVQSDDLQLHGVTIHNGATDAQAVAIRTGADKLHLMMNRFLGFQDTVALGITEKDSTQVQRVMVHMSYIEGEVDYVFGGASVVFDEVTFNTVAIKDSSSLTVFAPDTAPGRPYGFLVINSNITGDAKYIGTNKVSLGRSWDMGIASSDQYVAGKSPNGQLVIRDSNIDKVINVAVPWAAAATSKRAFTSDIKTNRDLNDNKHNRLWEYNNKGAGA